mgnify:CR=1 FL=1
MGGPGRSLFDGFALFDKGAVDGAVNGVATGVRQLGQGLRVLQPGFVRQYALGLIGGVVVVVAALIARLFA